MTPDPARRPAAFTDEQLSEWPYDAQFDPDAVDAGHDFDTHPLPRDTFPKYYAGDYTPTLAALFEEILLRREQLAAIRTLCEATPTSDTLINDVRAVLG